MPDSQDESLYFEPRKIHRLASGSPSRTSLLRVYSENERANFDQVTGSRKYDDDKHRPIPSGESSQWPPQSRQRRYSLDVEENNKKRNLDEMQNEMQDEYIPELDFADEVTKWLEDEPSPSSWEQSSVSFHSPWLESPNDKMSLHGNSSHAQVEPIPLPNASTRSSSLLAPQTGSAQTEPENFELPKVRRLGRKASGNDSVSSSLGDISTSTLQELKMTPEELVDLLGKLPSDFTSMAYSQRKKIIMDLLPNKDHRIIMSWLKKIMLTNSKSGTSLQNRNSFVSPAAAVRSRHGSVASQYLSSFSPANMGGGSIGSAGSSRPDDKGALILGHRLGRIIGFGAWGMIRECVDVTSGDTRAMKIVRFRNNNKVKRQVVKEVCIWKELNHTNILKLWKWKLEDDYAIYCLTDRINSGTLYDLVISWGEIGSSKIRRKHRCKSTIVLCLQVIKALKYMHSICIAHGDIKLENCLLEKPEGNVDDKEIKVVLCDFGMSTHFGLSYKAPKKLVGNKHKSNHGDPMRFNSASDVQNLMISKKPNISKTQSNPNVPSSGGGRQMSQLQRLIKNRKLTHDDTPLGVLSLPRTYGPALSSTHITSEPSLQHLVSPMNQLTPTMDVATPHSGTDASNVPDPHSHIGSLPYAAPELLEPSPPPLGPSADIWALGVMLYAMLTGKLPFKHDFEPRLRAMIASGKFNRELLKFAVIDDVEKEFKGLYETVIGCLTVDINARWSLPMIEEVLEKDSKR
ncbi:ZYRO0G18590p [Zygosaccharomyces rouxii]|uniref:non-specific serine/threonine protein kinase n=1 Tax=Zygosaccharomyces rouxii (strain ATCC 2623 / CBS 732 / NBRC 1130 / NCYC 568 / NRRL Y-229) TaxID=559307 RepID=C5E171_ZYGRC|nr:uncharacterized protein ZYRO0G18590g [Zygosaccharomyces rouxii]KAH9202848.1 kinase-like domain-containing protein [Zygosaccharomyces rouxii]CAR29855.1 ZYRO0G18590p [Zygosaccharomyces rouxii]